ncbi:unnamed protein product [Rotaria sordida]|uniref:Damage-inducible protein DinB n=2 Tax=Rotaria sordida TaxID=392033 RepID=A0A815WBV7_9BILA|nr:unnamed protein product [Rotaria sordida]CAF4193127.1 unnamed protein product [Rotaria sordida]
MAIYNRWAFRQLYNKLEEHIFDENYRANSGLFFRSIHGTVVHLLLSTNEWVQAITDRKDLYQPIFIECDRWIDYIKELNLESLMMEETFPYFDTKGMKIERNRAEALDHMFNHNTHHRGQITAAITKHGGYDASPVLDLVAMPKDEYNIIN